MKNFVDKVCEYEVNVGKMCEFEVTGLVVISEETNSGDWLPTREACSSGL